MKHVILVGQRRGYIHGLIDPDLLMLWENKSFKYDLLRSSGIRKWNISHAYRAITGDKSILINP